MSAILLNLKRNIKTYLCSHLYASFFAAFLLMPIIVMCALVICGAAVITAFTILGLL